MMASLPTTICSCPSTRGMPAIPTSCQICCIFSRGQKIIVSNPSSRVLTDIHRTSALDGSIPTRPDFSKEKGHPVGCPFCLEVLFTFDAKKMAPKYRPFFLLFMEEKMAAYIQEESFGSSNGFLSQHQSCGNRSVDWCELHFQVPHGIMPAVAAAVLADIYIPFNRKAFSTHFAC